MREMVFRERVEKVAQVRAFAAIAARLLGNMEVNKAFGDIIGDYASEVFQESYDPNLLKQKQTRLREAQERVRKKRLEDQAAIDRLQRMEKLGEEFEKRTTNAALAKRAK